LKSIEYAHKVKDHKGRERLKDIGVEARTLESDKYTQIEEELIQTHRIVNN